MNFKQHFPHFWTFFLSTKLTYTLLKVASAVMVQSEQLAAVIALAMKSLVLTALLHHTATYLHTGQRSGILIKVFLFAMTSLRFKTTSRQ
jgi:hypothetical protein